MTKSFVHLHSHSEYSLLDGASRISESVAAIKADGQPAMGITDHGSMYGVIPFYKECKAQGVKPIIGTEAYMAYDTRFERQSRKGKVDDLGGETESGTKQTYHITLLAENNDGYKNLIQLSSRAYLEGYYYKGRVDWELLAEHSNGVIATTGCLGGHVLQALMNEGYEAGLIKAARLQEIFGRDNLFVEIQDHGIPEQLKTNPDLIRIAKKLNAPLLATNDSHYVTRSGAVAHDALLCVQTGCQISDPDRFRFSGEEHYIKSSAEMRSLFPNYEIACDNSLWIAERANVQIDFGNLQLPQFAIPENFDSDSEYLEYLTFEKAKQRWDVLSDNIVERLAYELKVIADMGFSSYFLIVWDLIEYAKTHNIRVGPGRGSAAGCAVSYSLGITDLDPIRYDLLFERFLNPSRVSMPDIDMDFDSRYRDHMIGYAAEKYGRDHVAQIITFNTIKARAAVRDAARVLGKPFSLGDRIAKTMPPLVSGRDTPLAACIVEQPEFEEGYGMALQLRAMIAAEPEVKEVIDIALGLENLRRGDGIHAAAVVIAPCPITDLVPVQRKPKADEDPESAPIVTQYEMDTVESLGLLKMDFLGLKNLDSISDAVSLISLTHGIDIDMSSIPLDDHKTFELLQRADTIGVFQLESQQMRVLMRSLKPETFDDIAALVALYRPGPMGVNMHYDYADRKNNRKEIRYFHPEAEDLLSDTYGLMIYQESMMRVAQHFAGYSLAEADNLRKACGKKIRSLMAKERHKFVDGVEQQGYGQELGVELFNIIENFADYAFNKSHSYGYGLIAYQTAYLKANYMVEFFAALLTTCDTLERSAILLSDCRSSDVKVFLPNINESYNYFSTSSDGKSIVFGLRSIRNVGEGLINKIVEEREANGLFKSFYDFCSRVDQTVLNKKVIESLILSGAFETLGHSRCGLMNVFKNIIDQAVKHKKDESRGVMQLFSEEASSFGSSITIPNVEYSKKELLSFEKEMLGLYISDHPLSGMEDIISANSDCCISELIDLPDGSMVRMAGVITNLKYNRTKRGDMMASFQFEDLVTSVSAVVFPKITALLESELKDDGVVLIDAKLSFNNDTPNLLINNIYHFDDYAEESQSVVLSVKKWDEGLIEVLKSHPGLSDVNIMVDDFIVRLPDSMRVNIDDNLFSEIKKR